MSKIQDSFKPIIKYFFFLACDFMLVLNHKHKNCRRETLFRMCMIGGGWILLCITYVYLYRDRRMCREWRGTHFEQLSFKSFQGTHGILIDEWLWVVSGERENFTKSQKSQIYSALVQTFLLLQTPNSKHCRQGNLYFIIIIKILTVYVPTMHTLAGTPLLP